MGSVKIITAGDVGFMTSGHGVTHTERTPLRRRISEPFDMHGYQIWVALPKDKEDIEPNFNFFQNKTFPNGVLAISGLNSLQQMPLENQHHCKAIHLFLWLMFLQKKKHH